MKSIIQPNDGRCYLCGRRGTSADPLDRHHVFFGAYRPKSEEDGLTVFLHHAECHIFGPNSVHKNAEVCRRLQEEVQVIAMDKYKWTVSDFRARYGRNYIQSDDRCVVCGELVPEGRQVCVKCELKARKL